MRKLIVPCVLGLCLVVGCSLFGKNERDDLPATDPNSLEIMCFQVQPGSPPTMSYLKLEKSGPCYAMANASLFSPGAKIELPPETFEQCVELLKETDFFHMKSARPTGSEGTMSRSVKVNFKGQEHAVEERLPQRASPEFDLVMQFIAERTTPGKMPATR